MYYTAIKHSDHNLRYVGLITSLRGASAPFLFERCIMKDTYLYKVVKGAIVSELFDSENLPKDWYDSPEAAEKAAKPKKKVVKNDDSTGTDK